MKDRLKFWMAALLYIIVGCGGGSSAEVVAPPPPVNNTDSIRYTIQISTPDTTANGVTYQVNVYLAHRFQDFIPQTQVEWVPDAGDSVEHDATGPTELPGSTQPPVYGNYWFLSGKAGRHSLHLTTDGQIGDTTIVVHLTGDISTPPPPPDITYHWTSTFDSTHMKANTPYDVRQHVVFYKVRSTDGVVVDIEQPADVYAAAPSAGTCFYFDQSQPTVVGCDTPGTVTLGIQQPNGDSHPVENPAYRAQVQTVVDP
jgi:hypothetical protein